MIKAKTWWKLYFWLVTVMTIAEVGSSIFLGQLTNILKFSSNIIGVISLIGLYGFTYKKPIIEHSYARKRALEVFKVAIN